MKKVKAQHGSKTPRNSTASLSGRLAAYSATAGAALLAVPAAHATIQNITSFTYNSTTTTVPPSLSFLANNGVQLPFTAAGVFKQSFRVGNQSTTYGHQGNINAIGLLVNPGVAKLNFGQAIAGAKGNSHAGYAVASVTRGNYGTSNRLGQFIPAANGAVTGYVGLKSTHGTHKYYGWLNVKITADGNGLPDGIAVVAVPGEPGVYGAFGPSGITAGELASATPEPGTLAIGGLGLLALGARGLRELRRRRAEAAKN